MRRISFWMAVAAFLLVLTACGEKKANQTENGGEATDSLTENVEAVEDEDGFTSDAELAMRKMQTTWSKESIEGLPPEENGLDIVALAVAFCEKYSDFDANKQLVTYFTRRDQFNSDWYFVDEDLKNGYVRCGSGSEISSDVTACYWKKKDGHRRIHYSPDHVVRFCPGHGSVFPVSLSCTPFILICFIIILNFYFNLLKKKTIKYNLN